MSLYRENQELLERLELHEQALTWAVGTEKLPPTCPGHFMHLLIEAKERVDLLNNNAHLT
jgi:hypothetical protein